MEICADYFGDELPFPLPQIKAVKKNNSRAKADTKTVKVGDSKATVEMIKRNSKAPELKLAPALALGFDGLNPFETIVFH